MRYLILTLAFLTAAPTMAVDLTCTLPDAFITRGLELCEEMRVTLRIRTSEWSNDICASEFLRLGLLAGDRKSVKIAARTVMSETMNDAVDDFHIKFPRPADATECGDSILDVEFGEECDDGNLINGDGCDASCLIE